MIYTNGFTIVLSGPWLVCPGMNEKFCFGLLNVSSTCWCSKQELLSCCVYSVDVVVGLLVCSPRLYRTTGPFSFTHFETFVRQYHYFDFKLALCEPYLGPCPCTWSKNNTP